jgi:hypothetical protein
MTAPLDVLAGLSDPLAGAFDPLAPPLPTPEKCNCCGAGCPCPTTLHWKVSAGGTVNYLAGPPQVTNPGPGCFLCVLTNPAAVGDFFNTGTVTAVMQLIFRTARPCFGPPDYGMYSAQVTLDIYNPATGDAAEAFWRLAPPVYPDGPFPQFFCDRPSVGLYPNQAAIPVIIEPWA